MSQVNNVTLEYFTNPVYQSVLNRAGKGNGNNTGKRFNKGEHKFYRKRIAALIKEMNRGKFPSEELMNGYHVFATSIMDHFKVLDKCEIVQEQYIDGNGDEEDIVQDLFNLFDVSDNAIESECDASFNMIDASEPMMKKCIQAATLDNYVTVCKTEQETTKVIPVQLHIDLHDVKFKTKGIKPKRRGLETKTKKDGNLEDEAQQIK